MPRHWKFPPRLLLELVSNPSQLFMFMKMCVNSVCNEGANRSCSLCSAIVSVLHIQRNMNFPSGGERSDLAVFLDFLKSPSLVSCTSDKSKAPIVKCSLWFWCFKVFLLVISSQSVSCHYRGLCVLQLKLLFSLKKKSLLSFSARSLHCKLVYLCSPRAIDSMFSFWTYSPAWMLYHHNKWCLQNESCFSFSSKHRRAFRAVESVVAPNTWWRCIVASVPLCLPGLGRPRRQLDTQRGWGWGRGEEAGQKRNLFPLLLSLQRWLLETPGSLACCYY